jgi:hypothetical protein
VATSTSLRDEMKLIGIDCEKICNFSILERDSLKGVAKSRWEWLHM